MSARIEEVGSTVYVQNDTQTVVGIERDGEFINMDLEVFSVALTRNEAAQLAVALQRVLSNPP